MPCITEKTDTELYAGSHWVEKLREGDRLKLVKENEDAVVAAAWIPPAVGGTFGTLFINRIRDGRFAEIHRWAVANNGCGFDGSPLIVADCPFSEIANRPFGQLTQVAELQSELRQLQRVVNVMRSHLQGTGAWLPDPTYDPGTRDELPKRILDRPRRMFSSGFRMVIPSAALENIEIRGFEN